MLTTLLPHYTYRRLVVRLLSNWMRGKDTLAPRLRRRNFEHMRRFGLRSLRCNVCEHQGRPFFDFPDLDLRRAHRIGEVRETVQCTQCGATMRLRFLAQPLLECIAGAVKRPAPTVKSVLASGLGGLRILDTDAYSPISRLLRPLPGYEVSSFRPDLPMNSLLGAKHHNINLEQMPFPDDSFDVLLTSDVMEHVRDIDAAHAEIARVLKPGGQYIFTVPFDPKCETHHVLVDTSGPEDKFLVPAQYHGDPITGGILAYRVFGRDIFKDLDRVGLTAQFTELNDEGTMIENGDVFVATKHGAAASG
jgi:Methyltransferase domain